MWWVTTLKSASWCGMAPLHRAFLISIMREWLAFHPPPPPPPRNLFVTSVLCLHPPGPLQTKPELAEYADL